LYVCESSAPNRDNGPTLRLDTGLFDPVLGRSYVEIAVEGRGLHRTQEQGYLELRGPQASGLRLLESRVTTTAAEASVFDGIAPWLRGLPPPAGLPSGSLSGPRAGAQAAADRVRASFDVRAPEKSLGDLADGLRAIRAARASLDGASASPAAVAEARFLLGGKERDFEEALVRAAGVDLDPLVDRETLAPGESAEVSGRAFLAHREGLTVGPPTLEPYGDLRIGPGTSAPPEPPPDAAGQRRLERPDKEVSFHVTVGTAATPTVPYWLERPRKGEIFAWPH